MASHRQELERQYRVWRTHEIRWSWARLFTFLAATIALYALRETPDRALGVAAVLLIVFAETVRRHRRLRTRCAFGERLLLIADESLERCGGRLTVIRSRERPDDDADPACAAPTILDAGPVAPLTDQERDDLDLYASPVGVYGLLHRASTSVGARRLRDVLEGPCLSAERILARQACVRRLLEASAERVRLMAGVAGLRGHDDRLDTFVKTVRSAKPLSDSLLLGLLRWWSVPCGLYTVAMLAQINEGAYGWAWAWLALMGVNGVALLRIRPAVREALEPWRDLRETVGGIIDAANQARTDLPDDTELAQLRGPLAAAGAPEVLGALHKRLAWHDSGGPIHFLFNLVFFYDLHLARAVLKRIVPNRDTLLAAIGALADLEAMSSLACFAWEQPITCTPEPVGESGVAIDGGVHPLIEPNEAVANDVRLTPDERTWVVTGSNMAGKSTLLRMVGVNVLLAQVGTSATASQMTFQPCRLLTDLRIRDDLAKHESYFLAEVRQIRRMLTPRPDAAPLLGLIDEPFRGTNSQERIAADLAVVEQLIASPHYFLVATHEQQLADLADRTPARNVHFHEDLSDAGPVFDYSLRPGPATMRNALRILAREGYPDAVLRRAQDYLDQCSDG